MLFAALGPIAYFYPATFGRYSSTNSIFTLGGKIAWLTQEIVAPIVFLSHIRNQFGAFHLGQWITTIMFLGHYLNRALIWPLFIMPSMSPSHV